MTTRIVPAAWVLAGSLLLGGYARDLYFGLRGATDTGMLAASAGVVLLCATLVVCGIRACRRPSRPMFAALAILGGVIAAGAMMFVALESSELGVAPVFLAAALIGIEAATIVCCVRLADRS